MSANVLNDIDKTRGHEDSSRIHRISIMSVCLENRRYPKRKSDPENGRMFKRKDYNLHHGEESSDDDEDEVDGEADGSDPGAGSGPFHC